MNDAQRFEEWLRRRSIVKNYGGERAAWEGWKAAKEDEKGNASMMGGVRTDNAKTLENALAEIERLQAENEALKVTSQRRGASR